MEGLGVDSRTAGNSLAFRWLPEFDFVALWIHDPTELPVFGVVSLLQYVAAFFPKCLEECGQVLDAVVDHEGRSARCEVVVARCADRPDGRSLHGIAGSVGLREGGSAPFLHVDSEVLFVPSAQGDWVFRLHEYSADSCDSPHYGLRRVVDEERYNIRRLTFEAKRTATARSVMAMRANVPRRCGSA
jgi:hypothetical protein